MWKCPVCGREFARNGQSHYCGEKPAGIDEYISRQPEEMQGMLNDIRNTIRSALPDAAECISWSMPTWKGRRNVIQFALSKKHVGLYPGDEAVAHFADRLADYDFSKGSIRLPIDKPMPLELIADIARWCWRQDRGE